MKRGISDASKRKYCCLYEVLNTLIFIRKSLFKEVFSLWILQCSFHYFQYLLDSKMGLDGPLAGMFIDINA